MKLRVSFKTPDAVEYAIQGELVYAITDENQNNPDAVAEAREQLKADLEAVTNKYVRYGEEVTLEFDTETGTAIVVPK
jgi:hypothetical protein